MAKRMKWITNGVNFLRGNWEPIIARFDNSKMWLMDGCCCTADTFKASIRKLAQEYGASTVEVKPLLNEKDQPTEDRSNVVNFKRLSKGYWFYIPKAVPEGAKREFIEFSKEEVFA